MAISTWSSLCDHTSDATFRVWGKAIHDQLVAMSEIVNTADTGQINWTTVTKPGISTDAGYEIYYLNDSLHATAPIYFRIDYGTHSTSATRPRIKLTVGTSTNGSGTIGGTALTAANITTVSIAASATISYTSYLCVDEGFVGFVGWAGANTGGAGIQGFIISRSCDVDGAADTKGALIVNHGLLNINTPVYCQSLRFPATAAAYTRNNTAPSIIVPHAETTTQVGGVPQGYLAWHITPNMQPLSTLAGVLISEVPEFSTVTATLVGSTVKTYINIGTQLGTSASAATPGNFGLLMLWQ